MIKQIDIVSSLISVKMDKEAENCTIFALYVWKIMSRKTNFSLHRESKTTILIPKQKKHSPHPLSSMDVP